MKSDGEPSARQDHTATGSPEHEDSRRSRLINAALRAANIRITTLGQVRAGLLPLAWLTPEEVAAEAGLPVSVFEELWPPGADRPDGLSPFECFLWTTFSVTQEQTIKDHTTAALALHGSDLDELIRTGGIAEKFDEADVTHFLVALAVSCYSLHPRDDFWNYITEIADLCAHALYPLGRKLKEPFTWQHLAMNIAAVVGGTWMRYVVGVPDPNPVRRIAITPGSEVREWTLDGIATWAIITSMTEPLD